MGRGLLSALSQDVRKSFNLTIALQSNLTLVLAHLIFSVSVRHTKASLGMTASPEAPGIYFRLTGLPTNGAAPGLGSPCRLCGEH